MLLEEPSGNHIPLCMPLSNVIPPRQNASQTTSSTRLEKECDHEGLVFWGIGSNPMLCRTGKEWRVVVVCVCVSFSHENILSTLGIFQRLQSF